MSDATSVGAMRFHTGMLERTSSYRGSAEGADRAKAIAAVAAVHVLLAVIIFAGLRVPIVTRAIEQLQTIDIPLPPPPPPPVAPRHPQPHHAKFEEGAAGKKAEPSPIVAPPSRLPIPSPVPAAPVAGTGNAASAGAANAGNGTGAGGSGNGRGGGGDYSKFTPAQKITKIPDGEYRRLVEVSGISRGTVGISIRVTVDGSASGCRIVRSSGSTAADDLMCQLTERYVRFRPARDPDGRAVAQDITWYPNWWKP